MLTLFGQYSRRDFCERTGLATSDISQLVGGRQVLDDTTARQIEADLKLPPGWLDLPHTTFSGPVQDTSELLPVEERMLLAKFRQLNSIERVHVHAILDAFLAAQRANNESSIPRPTRGSDR